MRDPIWDMLKEQGRNMAWLARQTGYAHGTIRQVACGASPPWAEFRRRCAKAMSMSERFLFAPRLDGREKTSKVEEEDRRDEVAVG